MSACLAMTFDCPLRFLQGYMTITCPDGRVLGFGDADTVGVEDGDGTSSGAGRRVSIRVFDWWFFVRVAMEYDLGLARSGHSRV